MFSRLYSLHKDFWIVQFIVYDHMLLVRRLATRWTLLYKWTSHYLSMCSCNCSKYAAFYLSFEAIKWRLPCKMFIMELNSRLWKTQWRPKIFLSSCALIIDDQRFDLVNQHHVSFKYFPCPPSFAFNFSLHRKSLGS